MPRNKDDPNQPRLDFNLRTPSSQQHRPITIDEVTDDTEETVSSHEITPQIEEVEPFNSKSQAYIKALIKLTRQSKKAIHHIELLQKAIDTERPPRGLIPRVNPRLPDTPIAFLLEWEEELHRSGLAFTQQLKNYWTNRKQSIDKDFEPVYTKLESLLSPAQWQKAKEILEEQGRETEIDLQRKKPLPQRGAQRPFKQARERRERNMDP
jgi:hypothetical protein